MCYEPLDFGVNALTHCTKDCGNNFHASCLEAWLKADPDRPNCPDCKCKWKEHQDLYVSFPDNGADRKALSIFVGYLWTCSVALETIPLRPGVHDCEPLIRSFLIAEALLDERWARVVLQALLEAVLLTNTPLRAADVQVAYEITLKTSRLREAVIRAH